MAEIGGYEDELLSVGTTYCHSCVPLPRIVPSTRTYLLNYLKMGLSERKDSSLRRGEDMWWVGGFGGLDESSVVRNVLTRCGESWCVRQKGPLKSVSVDHESDACYF